MVVLVEVAAYAEVARQRGGGSPRGLVPSNAVSVFKPRRSTCVAKDSLRSCRLVVAVEHASCDSTRVLVMKCLMVLVLDGANLVKTAILAGDGSSDAASSSEPSCESNLDSIELNLGLSGGDRQRPSSSRRLWVQLWRGTWSAVAVAS